MENYTKGKNVEEPLEKDRIPIPNLPENFLWMRVNPGTKIKNVISFALKSFKDEKHIVWSGSGPAVEKTISCVEIMKRRHKSLHQITKICYRKVEEFWEPKLEGLDELVVVREVPTIHVLLSREPLDKTELGYQAPGSSNAMGGKPDTEGKKRWSVRKKSGSKSTDQRTAQASKRKRMDQPRPAKTSTNSSGDTPKSQ